MQAAKKSSPTSSFRLRAGYQFGLLRVDAIQMFGRCNEIRVYIYITGGAR